MDGLNNYTIWRSNLTSGQKEQVTTDRADCFTMDRNYIYYACQESPSLRRCDVTGGNTMILYQGIVNSINITSKYIYFKEYGNDGLYLHMPTDLSRSAEPFMVTAR